MGTLDKVFIRGLKVQTTIGFYDWEKQIKQGLVFDLEMGWNIKPAAQNDELAKTLDYAAVSEEISVFANANPVDLLETLAERLAKHLIVQYQLPWLKLTIHKPTAVHDADSVGVQIERSADDFGVSVSPLCGTVN